MKVGDKYTIAGIYERGKLKVFTVGTKWKIGDITIYGEEKMNFKSENHRKHYEMWMKLHREPYNNAALRLAGKKDVLGDDSIYGRVDNCCYACQEAYRVINDSCCSCPLDWGIEPSTSGATQCESWGTLYENWRHSTDPVERSRLAKQIAEMEWTLPEAEPKTIHMLEMKPLDIGRVTDPLSCYNNHIVMRTAYNKRFEVIDLTDLGKDRCWTYGSGLKVTLFKPGKDKARLVINGLESIDLLPNKKG